MAKIGHEQPIFDHRGEPEGTFFSQPEPEAIPDAVPLTGTVSEPEVEKKSPEQIKAEREQRVTARAKRWEELTNANWPPGRIEELLDKESPDLHTAERIEQLEVQDLAAQRRQARKKGGSKQKRNRTRKGLGPRQLLVADGPPAHVAKEIRGE